MHDVRLEKKSELIELSCSIGPSVRGSSKYGEDLRLRNSRIPYEGRPGFDRFLSTLAAKRKSSDLTLQILGTP